MLFLELIFGMVTMVLRQMLVLVPQIGLFLLRSVFEAQSDRGKPQLFMKACTTSVMILGGLRFMGMSPKNAVVC